MEPRHETRTLDLHPESVADDDWSALTEYVSILSEFASAPASILEMLIARSEDRSSIRSRVPNGRCMMPAS
jgi:hypothetical protein